MNILLMSIGTRGDIEPFLAIGELLSKKGHKVNYALPEQYIDHIPNEVKKYTFTSLFLELLESDDGRMVMNGSFGIKKLKAIYRLFKAGMKINSILVKEQYEIIKNTNPDIIIHNGKCNYPFIWHILTGKKNILISPIPYFIHYVKGVPHTGFNFYISEYINQFTYSLANFGLIKTIYDAQKLIHGSKKIASKKEIKENLKKQELIYTISPALFEKPSYWATNAHILGYHQKEENQNWNPDHRIIEFIEKHRKVVFLTFGSMVHKSPEKTSKLICNVLNELKIPAVINIAAGGLIELEEYRDHELFYFTKQIPYSWIFKKCYAVIHHGGSGTTHISVKYGCASLIIPHVFDQFSWNKLISKKDLGPKGFPVNKLTEKKLRPLIKDLVENESYKLKALEFSKKMQVENLEEVLYEKIISH